MRNKKPLTKRGRGVRSGLLKGLAVNGQKLGKPLQVRQTCDIVCVRQNDMDKYRGMLNRVNKHNLCHFHIYCSLLACRGRSRLEDWTEFGLTRRHNPPKARAAVGILKKWLVSSSSDSFNFVLCAWVGFACYLEIDQ